MSKFSASSKVPGYILWPFLALVFGVLLTPFWVFDPLLFPFITSKAFYFRILTEIAFPFFIYIAVRYPHLRPNWRNKLTWAILVFLGINLITAFAGVNVARSLWGNFERMGGVYYQLHLTIFYFYLLLLAKLSENYLHRFLQALITVSVALSLNAVIGKIGWSTLSLDPSLPDRASSTFGNPIFFASFLILPLSISLYFAVRSGRRWPTVAYSLCAFTLFVGIYLSGTRGAAVSLIAAAFCGLIFYLIVGKNRAAKKWGLAGLTVLVVLAGVGFMFVEKLPGGSNVRRIFELNDANSRSRLIQWKMAMEGFKAKPLQGVGPENYYVIAQEYNDPAINQYDRSWFDKPHNYYLEVLTTTGVGGLVAYVSILVLVMYALFWGFRQGLLAAGESVFLAAGFLAYLTQNLFVFDTVSPSVMFFIFCALAGYFFEITGNEKDNKSDTASGPAVAAWVFGLTAVAAVYAVYATNWLPITAARATNYGYGYGVHAPQVAIAYFTQARENPFNFDPGATAIRYSEFSESLLKSDMAEKDPQLVLEQIRQASEYQKSVTEKIDNDALLWIRLAANMTIRSLAEGKSIGEDSQQAVEKALKLAPRRVESWQALLQLASYKQDWKTAVDAAREMTRLNPHYPWYKAMFAVALYRSGNLDEAVIKMNEAIEGGYVFQSPQEFVWLIEYYRERQDHEKLAELYERYIDLQPSDLAAYVELARAYIQLGENDHARTLLDTVLLHNPAAKAELQPLYDQLK